MGKLGARKLVLASDNTSAKHNDDNDEQVCNLIRHRVHKIQPCRPRESTKASNIHANFPNGAPNQVRQSNEITILSY